MNLYTKSYRFLMSPGQTAPCRFTLSTTRTQTVANYALTSLAALGVSEIYCETDQVLQRSFCEGTGPTINSITSGRTDQFRICNERPSDPLYRISCVYACTATCGKSTDATAVAGRLAEEPRVRRVVSIPLIVPGFMGLNGLQGYIYTRTASDPSREARTSRGKTYKNNVNFLKFFLSVFFFCFCFVLPHPWLTTENNGLISHAGHLYTTLTPTLYRRVRREVKLFFHTLAIGGVRLSIRQSTCFFCFCPVNILPYKLCVYRVTRPLFVATTTFCLLAIFIFYLMFEKNVSKVFSILNNILGASNFSYTFCSYFLFFTHYLSPLPSIITTKNLFIVVNIYIKYIFYIILQ